MKLATQLLLLLLAAVAAYLASLLLRPLPLASVDSEQPPLAITHTSLLDVATGMMLEDRTILIEDGQILDIVAAAGYQPPSSMRIIDGRGKTAIPGLWDMHTHGLKLSPQLHHPLFIANGVTAVRDMSGCMSQPDSYWACIEDRRRWTREALAGERLSPRYVLQSSYQTNGGNEVPEGYPAFFKLAEDDHADKLTAFYRQAGADFIKTYSELEPAQYRAIAQAAAARKLHLAGHKPFKLSLEEALAAGQKSFEHGRLFLFECYRHITAFRQHPSPRQHYNADLMRDMLNQQDQHHCDNLMQTMAESDSWWVPTLTTLQMGARARDVQFREDPRLETVPFMINQLIWQPDADRSAQSRDSQGRFVHEVFLKTAMKQLARAQQQGVKLLIGTDAGDSYVFAGSSLHDEMAMWVEAGLAPADVLRSATLSAAEYAGLAASHGSIAPGKVADLLLLNGNPLHDISHTRNIDAVVFNGRYHDSAQLREMTDFATSQAQSLAVNVRFLGDALGSPLMRVQFAD